MQAIPYMLIGKMINEHSEKIRKIKPTIPFLLIIGGFILSYSEVVSLRVFNSFALATSGIYFHNYLGSVVTAVGFMMLSICSRHFGKRSGFALIGSMTASWMYIISEPMSIVLRHFISGENEDIFVLLATEVLSFVCALILSYIISLLRPEYDPDKKSENNSTVNTENNTSESLEKL